MIGREMQPSTCFLVCETLFQMARVAPRAHCQYGMLADSVYNDGLYSPWRSTCQMTKSICPLVSLIYSMSLLLSVQHPEICMLRHASNRHDRRTCSMVFLCHIIVHDGRRRAVRCDTSLLFLLDVPWIFILVLSRFSSNI
jgi:hypothetical protein